MTESGTLPDGLSFNDNGDGTATIAGTPNAGSGGTYPVTVTATNEYGSTSQSFTIKVDEAPTITSSNNATAAVGNSFSFQITSTGYPDPNFSKTGTLPSGLSFHGRTGIISGTPKTGTTGTYVIVITAKNSSGSDSQSFTLTVQSQGQS